MRINTKNIKEIFTFRGINKVIKVLIFTDILMVGSMGLISPVFAIFITDMIPGGTVEVVGIASTIYLLTKSLGSLFIAEMIDRIKGEKDDFWSMFIGSLIMCLVYALYLVINAPWQLYLVQFVNGLAASLAIPAWMGIFTRHVDKEHVGKAWGMYYTGVDLSTAATAAIGGIIAYTIGFKPLFIIIVLIGVLATLLLLVIKKDIHMPAKKKKKRV